MAGALRHDFVRTLRTKSVLVSMAVIVVLSLGLVPLVKLATSPVPISSGGTVVAEYYSGGLYHFLAYSYNTYGQPVSGTPVNVTFFGPGAPPSSTGSTNSSGYAAWTVGGGLPSNNFSFLVTASGNELIEGTFSPSPEPGEVGFIAGDILSLVQDPANSSRSDVLFAYIGPNGTVPSMYRIYYSYGSSNSFNQMNESEMSFLGVPNSYATVFKLPQAPAGTTTTQIGAFDVNGTAVASSTYSYQVVGGPSTPPTPQQLFTSFTSSILSLVIPLMAILVAFNTYGKDRATGVLESVLARPVTRLGLGVTRYLSSLLSISVAIIISLAAMEAISQALIGKILAPEFVLYTFAALFVEAASFVGLTMLISHLLKSAGAIEWVAVGLWIVLDFFWSVIVLFGALALGVEIGSGNYLGVTIDLGFLNPAQYYGLVGEYLNGVSITSNGGGSIPISPATYGLTPLTLTVAAVLWVVVPLAGFLYLARRRD